MKLTQGDLAMYRKCCMLLVLMCVLLLAGSAYGAAPTYVNAGNVMQSTGAISVPWPTHVSGDVALLVIESANQTISLSTPAGFAEVTGSPQGTGTAGGTSATRLAVYWKRATTSAEANPTVADSGNHQIARIFTFRGVIASGNPWDVTASNVASTASTSVSIPGATTTVADTLVAVIVSNATDTTTAQTTNVANANLTGLAMCKNNNTSQGNGGGYGIWAGVKAAAGAYGTTTATLLTSSVQGRMSIALKSAASAPGAATNPSPANGATNVGITTDLSWTAGSGATSHNVYFGTTSPGAYIGNQTATTYDTGTMPNGTVHYWRIDEVNASGTTTGTVWNFTTIVAAPGAASSPSPANGATSVGVTTDLSWTAGSGATSHNVYFGTTSPGTSRGNQTATTYDTGTMPNSTVHYWRIDEVNAGGTTTGTVWSFTTVAGSVPGAASNPSPANSATGVGVTTDLSWTAGSGATSHNVYFGTTSPGVSQGNQAGTTFDTGTMPAGTVHYWRIDEVNAYGTTTGTVWSFTTAAGGAPGAASNPSPTNGSNNIPINVSLYWTAGADAASHKVYGGTGSPSYLGETTNTTWPLDTLAPQVTYYWRVDEVNPGGTTTGTTWTFTTGTQATASDFSPYNGGSWSNISNWYDSGTGTTATYLPTFTTGLYVSSTSVANPLIINSGVLARADFMYFGYTEGDGLTISGTLDMYNSTTWRKLYIGNFLATPVNQDSLIKVTSGGSANFYEMRDVSSVAGSGTYEFRVDGGYANVTYMTLGPNKVKFQLNGGRLDNWVITGYTSSNLIINFAGGEMHFPLASFNSLVANGNIIKSYGVAVNSGNVSSLLDVTDLGNGWCDVIAYYPAEVFVAYGGGSWTDLATWYNATQEAPATYLPTLTTGLYVSNTSVANPLVINAGSTAYADYMYFGYTEGDGLTISGTLDMYNSTTWRKLYIGNYTATPVNQDSLIKVTSSGYASFYEIRDASSVAGSGTYEFRVDGGYANITYITLGPNKVKFQLNGGRLDNWVITGYTSSNLIIDFSGGLMHFPLTSFNSLVANGNIIKSYGVAVNSGNVYSLLNVTDLGNGWCDVQAGTTADTKPRVIVSTDIGGSDPDDFQSMVHYLVYADKFQTEGLLSSPPEPTKGSTADILAVINAYETDYSNLNSHAAFPTPQSLRDVTKQGAFYVAPAAGYSTATEGSNWIISRANVADPRPLWILVWGSITDVAQAVHDDPLIKSKIRVYSIGGWNTAMDPYARNYLYNNHSDMWWIECDSTGRGMYIGGDQSGDLGNDTFVAQHVRYHGALGDFYYSKQTYIKMGDTSSVLYLLNGNPNDPTTEHWGGMFGANAHGSYYWKDLTDAIYSEGGYYGVKTVSVHRVSFLRDWQTRMDWADSQ